MDETFLVSSGLYQKYSIVAQMFINILLYVQSLATELGPPLTITCSYNLLTDQHVFIRILQKI